MPAPRDELSRCRDALMLSPYAPLRHADAPPFHAAPIYTPLSSLFDARRRMPPDAVPSARIAHAPPC
jgi:hypothetical protein